MKRWMLRAATVATTAVTMVVGAAAPSLATSGWKWASNSTYGHQGENVIGSGLTVSDIAAHFVPPTRDYFTGHAWRFVISRYACDPRGTSKSVCSPGKYFYGKKRTGNPPLGGQTCTSIGLDGTGVTDCQNYGLASAYVSHGDYVTSVPRTFPSGTWLCTEIQINTNLSGTGTWRFNRDNQIGLRACAEVHS